MSVQARPWTPGEADPQAEGLLEKVVSSENLNRAWKQVKRNKGAAGVDGRGIGETGTFLKERWPEIREQLLEGTYKPYPVLRVEIPGASGFVGGFRVDESVLVKGNNKAGGG